MEYPFKVYFLYPNTFLCQCVFESDGLCLKLKLDISIYLESWKRVNHTDGERPAFRAQSLQVCVNELTETMGEKGEKKWVNTDFSCKS